MSRTRCAWFLPTVLAMSAGPLLAEEERRAQAAPRHDEVVYKTVGDVSLHLHIFRPTARDGKPRGRERPTAAIMFFHGGGWNRGHPSQFFKHCEHFASRGMVAVSAEYRIRSKHGTTPFECVADGKSAVRWVRAHASELGIDANRIAAGGGSAGGHVAACTATIQGFDEKGEDLSISSVPNALVLFNPVLDLLNTPRVRQLHELQDRAKELSPCEHLRKNLPPTIIFHGTADEVVPFETAERFRDRMRELGNRCDLIPFKGKGHGFFNYDRDADHRSFRETLRAADKFLVSLRFLKAPPSAP